MGTTRLPRLGWAVTPERPPLQVDNARSGVTGLRDLVWRLRVGQRGTRPRIHRRKAAVEGSLPQSSRWPMSPLDPKAPDDVCNRYGGLLIFKLPLAAH